MNFLYMICEEYHDEYSNYCTVVCSDIKQAFRLADDYEYNMAGYACVMELHGPVQPDTPNHYVAMKVQEELRKPPKYQHPTLGSLLQEILS